METDSGETDQDREVPDLAAQCSVFYLQENLKAIRARDKAAENAQKEAEEAERRCILEAGGNPDQVMLIKKRQLQQELKRQ